MKKHSTALFIGIFGIILSMSVVDARLIFTQEAGVETDAFTIDYGDNSQDFIDLEFGSTLGARLRFDTLNDKFILNRDLDLSDNEALNLRIENLSAAPTCDGTVTGKVYHDTTENDSYICNGTDWEQIDSDVAGDCGHSDSYSFGRGTVVSNAAWAVGNGQTPWGAPMACSGTVNKIAATCTNAIGTSLSAVLRKNNVATTCTVNIATAVGQVTISDCTESFDAGDTLGIYAGTEVGAWSECVGSFWIQYDS